MTKNYLLILLLTVSFSRAQCVEEPQYLPFYNWMGYVNIECFKDGLTPTNLIARATTGDLILTPLITNNNQLTNGSNYVTSPAMTTAMSGKMNNPSGNTSQYIDGTGALQTFPSIMATNNTSVYSAGTVYNLTTTSQKVDFGTTDPVITLPTAGTYILMPQLKISYSGLTTLLNTCNFKLRRTNNTASDIPNVTTNFDVVATLLTGTGGDVDLPFKIYTTATSGDVIEMWANRQNGLSITGNIQVSEASIVAYRLY